MCTKCVDAGTAVAGVRLAGGDRECGGGEGGLYRNAGRTAGN